MGKRSSFSRVDKDLYRTIDQNAVDTLLPFLEAEGIQTFCEPCYGFGDLDDSLSAGGLSCVARYDIAPKFIHQIEERPNHGGYVIPQDAAKLTARQLNGADAIITNPPWTRHLLHSMIEVWTSIAAVVWVLFDANWSHTTQKVVARTHGVKTTSELLSTCTDIVSVGRLRWIPGTTMKGKDDCAWFRFDGRAIGKPVFHGR